MDFTRSARQRHRQGRVAAFMAKHVCPAVALYEKQLAQGERWKVLPLVEDLKRRAKAEGLRNLSLPPSPDHDGGDYRSVASPISNMLSAPKRWDESPSPLRSSIARPPIPALRVVGAEGAPAAALAGRRYPLRLSDDGAGAPRRMRPISRRRSGATGITMSSRAANVGLRAQAIRVARS